MNSSSGALQLLRIKEPPLSGTITLPLNQVSLLVGPSGSGKTTLIARILMQESAYRRSLLAHSVRPFSPPAPQRRAQVGGIEQLPLTAFHITPLASSYCRRHTLGVHLGASQVLSSVSAQHGSAYCTQCRISYPLATSAASNEFFHTKWPRHYPERRPPTRLRRFGVAGRQSDLRDHHRPTEVKRPSGWSTSATLSARIASAFDGALTSLAAVTRASGPSALASQLELALSRGFARIVTDTKSIDLNETDDALSTIANDLHADSSFIAVVVDRLRISNEHSSRIEEALSQCRSLGSDTFLVTELSLAAPHKAQPLRRQFFSDEPLCPQCGSRAHADTLTAAGVALTEAGTVSLHQLYKRLSTVQCTAPRFLEKLSGLVNAGLGEHTLDTPLTDLPQPQRDMLQLSDIASKPAAGALYLFDCLFYGLTGEHQQQFLQERLSVLIEAGGTVLISTPEPSHFPYYNVAASLPSTAPSFAAAGSPAAPPPSEPRSADSPACYTVTTPNRFQQKFNSQEVCFRAGTTTVLIGNSPTTASQYLRHIVLPHFESIAKDNRESISAHQSKARLNIVYRDTADLLRTPHTALTVASYSGLLVHLRRLFAKTLTAKKHGLRSQAFSLAQHGPYRSRFLCSTCHGTGRIITDIWKHHRTARCPSCHGERFRSPVSNVRFKGVSFGQLLALTALQAQELLRHIPACSTVLEHLCALGLSHIALGQPLTQVSSGELTRIHLSRLLAHTTCATVILLDQPFYVFDHSLATQAMRYLSGACTRLGVTLIVAACRPELGCGSHLIDDAVETLTI